MDYEDFNEKLMEHAKARKEYLNKKLGEVRKRRPVLEENQIQHDDYHDDSDESPKRQCLDYDDDTCDVPQDMQYDKENNPENRFNCDLYTIKKDEEYAVQKGLKSFGQQKVELEHSFESDSIKYIDDDDEEEDEEMPCVSYGVSQVRGLAALKKMNAEEKRDDLIYTNADEKEAQGFVKSPSASKLSYDFSENGGKTTDAKDSNQELGPITEEEEDECVTTSEGVKKAHESTNGNSNKLNMHNKNASPRKQSQFLNLASDNIVSNNGDKTQTSSDPAELPLSARKALFEKAFCSSTPPQGNVIDTNLSVAQRAALFEKAAGVKPAPMRSVPRTASPSSSVKSPMKASPVVVNKQESPVKMMKSTASVEFKFSKSDSSKPIKEVLSPSKNVGTHTRLVQQQLIESSCSTWQKKDHVAKAGDERKKEISALLNHWEKVSSSSDQSPTDGEIRNGNLPEKYVNVFDEGCDEDCSDVDNDNDDGDHVNNETVSEDESSEGSDPEEEEEEDSNDDYSSQAESGEYSVSCKSSRSPDSCDQTYDITKDSREIVAEMEQLLDDPLGHDNNTTFAKPLPVSNYESSSQKSKSSSSSSSGKGSLGSSSSQKAVFTQQCSTSSDPETSSSGITADNTEIPLLHTVSFYRKQKQEKRATPVRTIVRREQVLSPPSPEVDNASAVQERLKALQDEVLAQQIVISQTSQALNLCFATEEFSGSSEQVEGERLLLIATQKRQACLNEIQRLKTHGAYGSHAEEGTGSLVINDIKLLLKSDFINLQASGKGNDTIHYFMCLVRYGHQVIVTQMLSTEDGITNGALCFTNHIVLHELPPDFSVAFEVYALKTKKEVLPHDRKYHIKKDHSKIRLTPKCKKSDSKLLAPAISSPGGPNAVRTPSFSVIGFTRFTLQNCDRQTCTLDKVPFSSPLEGVLHIKMQLHAEHNVVEKGFLTMFEDVSGFGAWHRRWCVLDTKEVAFWKYPDDEKKYAPILMIDLRHCITGQIKLVSRDVCARAHTFELVTVRPQEEGDKNSLISRSVNTLTTTKYLLSADTKEERIMWCKRLNKALTNVRKWEPQALRPIERKQ